MSHAPYIATRFVSFETARKRPNKRKSIFRIIFQALHYSRRLQAERTLHQHRHLIRKAESNRLCELNRPSGANDDE